MDYLVKELSLDEFEGVTNHVKIVAFYHNCLSLLMNITRSAYKPLICSVDSLHNSLEWWVNLVRIINMVK